MDHKLTLMHGTCVQYKSLGILMTGPSGSGKSDLALRLIHQGGCLIADDQFYIKDHKIAHCPPELKGKLEVRGLGIISQPFEISWPIHLELCLMDSHKIKRMPDIEWGQPWTKIPFDPFQQSAIARLDILCGLLLKQYELVA